MPRHQAPQAKAVVSLEGFELQTDGPAGHARSCALAFGQSFCGVTRPVGRVPGCALAFGQSFCGVARPLRRAPSAARSDLPGAGR